MLKEEQRSEVEGIEEGRKGQSKKWEENFQFTKVQMFACFLLSIL